MSFGYFEMQKSKLEDYYLRRKLKILGITPFIWSGGSVPSLYEVQEEFVKMGHEVHLVAPSVNPLMLSSKKSFDRTTSKIFVRRFRFPSSLCSYIERFQSTLKMNSKSYFFVGGIKATILFFFFTLLSIIKTWEITKKVRPDVIYGHTYLGVFPAFLASKICRVPCVTRCYGVFVPGITDSKDALRVSVFRFLINPGILFLRIPTDLVIITNDGTGGNEVAKKIGVHPNKIRFWRNGINKRAAQIHFDKRKIREKIGISADNKVIVSVSRLVGWKHVDRIINAIPYIVAKYPDVMCLIVGEGPEKDKLKRMSNELGVGKYVKFIGGVSHDEVFDYLGISDICVFLYDSANVSNSLLEAMICGKCVVTLNNGWTEEIIKNRENGIILDKTELKRLPDIIVELLDNPKSISKLGKNAQEYALANLQTWRERADMEIKEIQNLVDRRRVGEK